jgi:hypothetical protein
MLAIMRMLGLAIGLFLALAAPAGAATITVTGWAPGPYGSSNLSGSTIAVSYDAAPGEANDLRITRDGAWRVGLDGSIPRRLGAGEKNVSLSVLLGSDRHLAAGRYWVTLAARTADGRTAVRSAVLRILSARAR